MNITDENQLLEALKDPATRHQAFTQIVNNNSRSLYVKIRRIVISHHDTDDVLQNVFLKAWKNIGQFKESSKISTWLYRIAINESIDFLRKKQNRKIADNADKEIKETLAVDLYFDGDEAQRRLKNAMETLPEVQRAVFVMKYFDDMKYSEISQILNTSEGALKASYHIAVKKIITYIQSND